ncbi:hypothetical protein B0T22DRAFT_165528 [Podospora appendiculata]|uniref:Uncharacterized protein n=1 Tax=Podospora appendiculata TaxID=314037 RepID=A0AAE0XB27_9PEZI|nr:hypothetical protein B0T22DRAFT_165528 [Podospora appendiculata]
MLHRSRPATIMSWEQHLRFIGHPYLRTNKPSRLQVPSLPVSQHHRSHPDIPRHQPPIEMDYRATSATPDATTSGHRQLESMHVCLHCSAKKPSVKQAVVDLAGVSVHIGHPRNALEVPLRVEEVTRRADEPPAATNAQPLPADEQPVQPAPADEQPVSTNGQHIHFDAQAVPARETHSLVKQQFRPADDARSFGDSKTTTRILNHIQLIRYEYNTMPTNHPGRAQRLENGLKEIENIIKIMDGSTGEA